MSKILEKSHDSWQTPPNLFKVLNEEFEFDLDAAASVKNALNARYIDAERDALKTEWQDTWSEWRNFPVKSVFCNPPYSMLGPFVQRAWEQSQKHRITTVVLIPAYSDPKYWSNYVMQAHEVRFLKGRLAFIDEDGMKKQSARFPSVVVVNRWVAGNHYGKGPNIWTWDWRVKHEIENESDPNTRHN